MAPRDVEPPNGPVEGADLAQLYRRYAGWLGGVLRRRFGAGVGGAVEDLVQETYLRIAPYQARGVVRHPRALLVRVASNLARDHLRRARRGGALPLDSVEAAAADEPFAAPEQDEILALKQAILSLPEPLRQVFLLSRFAGLTNQAIAAHYGLSLKTVEWRMTKALTHLAARLRH